MSYPLTLDNFIDPLPGQTLNSPSHSGIETAQNAALAALQTYVGTVGSTSTSSISYKLSQTFNVTSVIPASSINFGASSIPASSLFGLMASSVQYSASAIPASALFGTTTTAFNVATSSYGASSLPASSVFGVLPSTVLLFKNSTTTKNAADASTTQTITHSLGQIPKKITVTCMAYTTAGGNLMVIARAVYAAGAQSSQSTIVDGSGTSVVTTLSLNTAGAGTGSQDGVIGNLTTTTYDIVWTKNNNSATGGYTIISEVEA